MLGSLNWTLHIVCTKSQLTVIGRQTWFRKIETEKGWGQKKIKRYSKFRHSKTWAEKVSLETVGIEISRSGLNLIWISSDSPWSKSLLMLVQQGNLPNILSSTGLFIHLGPGSLRNFYSTLLFSTHICLVTTIQGLQTVTRFRTAWHSKEILLLTDCRNLTPKDWCFRESSTYLKFYQVYMSCTHQEIFTQIFAQLLLVDFDNRIVEDQQTCNLEHYHRAQMKLNQDHLCFYPWGQIMELKYH